MEASEDGGNRRRRVSLALALGILFCPLVFVWFTLRQGYQTLDRVIGFLWLLIAFVLSFVISVYEREQGAKPSVGSASMEVNLGGHNCAIETPIAVEIKNNSETSMENYSWNISVKARGHSTELNANPNWSNSDFILSPGQTVVFCEAMPALNDYSYPVDQLEFLPGEVAENSSKM